MLTDCFLIIYLYLLWLALIKTILKDEVNVSKVQFGNNKLFARLALYNLKVDPRGFKND